MGLIIESAHEEGELQWMQGVKREGTGRAEGPSPEQSLSEGHPGTPGTRQNSGTVPRRVGGWVLVGTGLPGVLLQCMKNGAKTRGG